VIRFLAPLALLVPLPTLAERVGVDIDCKPTKRDLVYDCRILLKDAKSGQPVGGAEVSIGADMPSMPMAHNVRAVKAKPGAAPGEYLARIELEMHGEWALKLDVRGAVRDVIVRKLDFSAPK